MDTTPVLVHGDARELSRYVGELLPNGVDDIRCVVTSPPYKDSGGYSPQLMQEVALEFDKMRYPGPLFINFGDLTAHPWRSFETAKLFCDWGDMYLLQTIIWVKNHYTPRQGHRTFDSRHEYIFYIVGDYDKPPCLRRTAEHVGVPYSDKSNVGRYGGDVDAKCPGTVWYIPYETIRSGDDKTHPHRFPVALPTRAIAATCEPDGGGCVADPFAGSGTTLVAAREQGHTGLGIEVDPDYITVTVERLGGDCEVVNYDPDKKIPFKRLSVPSV
jgi:site-specific DNA-methyltransferase (adenine-specific)